MADGALVRPTTVLARTSMRTYEPRGIEISPPREASPTNDPDAGLDEEQCAEIDLALSDLIERRESTDWSDVPRISTAEAAAWTSRMVEAREKARAVGRQDGA